MNGFALLIFVGALRYSIISKGRRLPISGSAESSIEDSSNLTSPNNPTVTTGEMFNGTGTEGYEFK